MRKIRQIIGMSLWVSSLALVSIHAQTPGGKWIRVQSDDGIISAEVPEATVYFANKTGFVETASSPLIRYELRNMQMLSAYQDGTLVVLESYEASPKALGVIYSNETREKTDKREIKTPSFVIKEATFRKDRYTMIRQFFAFENRIYLLTVASRDPGNPYLTRFLQSVRINTGNDPASSEEMTKFSKLPRKEPLIEVKIEKDIDTKGGSKSKGNPDVDASVRQHEVLFQPRAAYPLTETTRFSGSAIVKITLDPNGFVSWIRVRKSLPEVLLRQVMFAAARIKFLPSEKDGLPRAFNINREYLFVVN